jgi:hypothetical protein
MVAIPLLFLLTTAILADSIAVALAVFSFYMANRALTLRRTVFATNAGLLAVLCVSGFIFSTGWLEFREGIRSVVWEGGSSDRAAEAMIGAVKQYDIGTSFAFDTLANLDARLNQNIFVGLAIEKLQRLPDTYENGQTIMLALLGWVPRPLWPGKPERGGSEFMAKHTGLEFSAGTTFGVGAIYEFYVNFGYSGVFCGFLVLGGVVRLFDIFAARNLLRFKTAEFAQFQLAGIALLDPLSDLFFLVTLLVSALLFGWILRIGIRRYLATSKRT